MAGFGSDGGEAVDPDRSDGWVYFVRECGFTFQFVHLGQLETAIEYFANRVHPSSRTPHTHPEHWHHRWFERLPAGLTGGGKRTRILRALTRALSEFRRV